jgi:nicotinate (nicotinamide) nucleotide adenylyltransferase
MVVEDTKEQLVSFVKNCHLKELNRRYIMKIGILGGTFNPIHAGHLHIANEAIDKLKVNKVIFVPTGNAPHKDIETSNLLRLKLIRESIKINKKFEYSGYEVEKHDKCYTIDTIEYFKTIYPEDELFLIIGTDQAELFTSWKDYKKICELCTVAVMNRKGYKGLESYGIPNAYILDIEDPMEISSTEIKRFCST